MIDSKDVAAEGVRSTFTPGPWGYYAPPVTGATNPNGAAFVIGPQHVYMDKSAGYSIADCRLIAAAPDLLEALQAICAELDGDWDYDAKAIARHAGRAAIAQATLEPT